MGESSARKFSTACTQEPARTYSPIEVADELLRFNHFFRLPTSRPRKPDKDRRLEGGRAEVGRTQERSE